MTSATKERLLRHLDENKLLATPMPSLMPRGPRDLSGDQPVGAILPEVASAATQALQSGQTHYVDVPGIGPLRTALAAYLQDSSNQIYESDNILITAGVQEARFLTIQKIGEQFEEVIIPSVVHPGVRRALGTRSIPFKEIEVDEANGMLASPADIRAALQQGGRLIYLESPSRLTGQTYDLNAVNELSAILQEFEAAVIWDQGLAPWLPANSYASPTGTSDLLNKVSVLGEAWPGMGLDSWFLGYIAAGPDWFEPMRSQKQIMAICTSTASQYAALTAGEAYGPQQKVTLAKMSDIRQSAVALAVEKGLVPLAGRAANILAFRPTKDARETQKLLKEAGYAVANGADFGAPGVLRIKVTTDNSTVDALQCLV